jgi:hypothetical protein
MIDWRLRMNTIQTLAVASLAGISLMASTAMATEEKYPAWNFQPSVIFSNPELIEKTSGALATTPSTGTVAQVPQQAAAAPQQEPDAKYPAAYFNPTLLYPAN